MKNIRKIIATLAICTMSFSAVGCKMIEKTPEAIQKTVIATIGDTKVTRGDFENFLKNNYGLSIDKVKEQFGNDYFSNENIQSDLQTALDEYITAEILNTQTDITVSDEDVDAKLDESMKQIEAQYAQQGSLADSLAQIGTTEEEFKASQRKQVKASLISQEIVKDAVPTDADIETYYNENKEKAYTKGAGAKCSHILISEKKEDGSIDEEASLAKAKQVKAELNGGASFADLAAKYGTDGTKDKGGSLGYIEYDTTQYDKDFVAGFKELKEGEVSEPVKTQFGYHLIKAEGIADSYVVPFEEAKDAIKQQLEPQMKNKAYSDKLAQLKETYKVTIKEKSLDPTKTKAKTAQTQQPQAQPQTEPTEGTESK